MAGSIVFARTLPGLLRLSLLLVLSCSLVWAQRTQSSRQQGQSGGQGVVTLRINVRDARGVPPDSPATVQLNSSVGRHDIQTTHDASIATFSNVLTGEYDIEVRCLGYKTQTDHLSLSAMGSEFSVYVYIHPDSEPSTENGPPAGVTVTPKLQSEIEKGLDLMRKKNFEAAKAHFAKAAQMAPGNPDVAYLQGTADLALQHTDDARHDFEHALSLNPSHEKALLSLGELQLRAGETDSAITTEPVGALTCSWPPLT
jgi:tetratricopeptide (TPR) repeat protein